MRLLVVVIFLTFALSLLWPFTNIWDNLASSRARYLPQIPQPKVLPSGRARVSMAMSMPGGFQDSGMIPQEYRPFAAAQPHLPEEAN